MRHRIRQVSRMPGRYCPRQARFRIEEVEGFVYIIGHLLFRSIKLVARAIDIVFHISVLQVTI